MQIIISEARLPVSAKSIPPVSIGGIAGGEKFITQGMLSHALVLILWLICAQESYLRYMT